jgi:hypothetical protein
VSKVAVLITIALILSGCWSDPEVTGTTNKCATDLYPKFNAKIMAQCVDVCIRCDRGSVTTCTTSCTLRGAQ